MNYRHAQLLAPEDLGPAGTKTIDIDLDQPISRLDIRFKTSKLSAGMSAPSPANISKIELVDGSQVLHSLSGYENQALAYYNRRGVVMDHGQHINTSSEVDMYALDFGRYLWDPVLAFLPKNFRNPQLKITWDEDVSDTSVTVNEMEIVARIFDEKVPSPIGFLRAIEEYSYTVGANDSYETIKLAEDMVIRQILVRAHLDGYEPWYNINEARLDENNLQRIPFDYTNLEDYYRMMKAVWPLITLQVALQGRVGDLVSYIPQSDYWASVVLLGMGSLPGVHATNVENRGGKLNITCDTAAPNLVGLASGYLPWHCYQFPMGKPDDVDDWYNPTGKSPRLRLRAKSSSSTATGQVVLEQLQRY